MTSSHIWNALPGRPEGHRISLFWRTTLSLVLSLLSTLAAAAAPRITPADLTRFFDAAIPAQLAQNQVAGAVVSVVKDGKIVFAKGYGYADVENQTPVSASDTLFRIGSVSKLFTWIAVMQLVEQNKLNLDADINGYLDFTIPGSTPITLRQLMTHTAGFEERYHALFLIDLAQAGPLRDYVINNLPARIYAPGQWPAYSNYGNALAGYIVQRVSGEPFDAYVQRHILNPLRMTHSSTLQPLPDALQYQVSNAYETADQPPRPFELIGPAPAGSMSATAQDMARFMLSQLAHGVLDGQRILQPATVALMQAPAWRFAEGENAMDLGWYEASRNGVRRVGHGGDTVYFHSDLQLIPGANLGIFVSYNSLGSTGADLRAPLLNQFVDRYFPRPYQPGPAIASAVPDAQKLAGYYMMTRRGQTGITWLPALLQQVRVVAFADGHVEVHPLFNPPPTTLQWHETAPGYWQESSPAQRHLFVKQQTGGRVVLSTGTPVMVWQQMAWYQSRGFWLPFLLASFALCALSALVTLGSVLLRHPRLPLSGPQRLTRFVLRLAALLHVLQWAVFVGTYGFSVRHEGFLGSAEFDTLLGVNQLLAWLAVICTVAAGVRVVRAGRMAFVSPWRAVGYGVVLLGCLGLVAGGVFGNFLRVPVVY